MLTPRLEEQEHRELLCPHPRTPSATLPMSSPRLESGSTYTTTFKPLSVGAGTNNTPLEHLHITQFEQNLVELGSSCGLDDDQL